MIVGLGVDMIEVERMAAKIGKESGFRELVFSPGEIEYCEKKTHKHEHYAARFAAKPVLTKLKLLMMSKENPILYFWDKLPDPLGKSVRSKSGFLYHI
jgi:phosphopantetheine--protein transferase-like protein